MTRLFVLTPRLTSVIVGLLFRSLDIYFNSFPFFLLYNYTEFYILVSFLFFVFHFVKIYSFFTFFFIFYTKSKKFKWNFFFVTQLMRFVCCVILLFGGSFVAQSYLVSFLLFWNKLSLGVGVEENLGCGNLAGGFLGILLIILKASFVKFCSLKHRKWLLERFLVLWQNCPDLYNHHCTLTELYNLNVLFTSVQCIFHYYLFDFGDTFFFNC